MKKIPRYVYKAWWNAKNRCLTPSYRDYHRYGGRGIRMCKRWLDDPEAFYKELGPRPSRRHVIDRINNNGNYEPGNMRWATPRQSSRNSCRPAKYLRANRALFVIQGVSVSQRDIRDYHPLPDAVYSRFKVRGYGKVESLFPMGLWGARSGRKKKAV